jgi:protein-tyrosine-phosphatase
VVAVVDKVYNVLFLCTGNSARSLMAEALINYWGKGRFRGYSAGSFPRPAPHPYAIELLNRLGFPTEGLHSKSWNVYAQRGAPEMDFVFTVCDQAAKEPCPVWPGQPMTAHWGVADPAAVNGTEREKREAFRRAFRELENRIKIFVNLRVEALDRIALKRKVDEIGRIRATDPVKEGA